MKFNIIAITLIIGFGSGLWGVFRTQNRINYQNKEFIGIDVMDMNSYIDAEVTAYCPKECCCKQYADGLTASGYIIQPGDKLVAAPIEYPFGTKIRIPGYNNGLPVPVRDRGGAIKGNKFDVFFPTHEQAKQWGRQYLKIVIEQ